MRLLLSRVELRSVLWRMVGLLFILLMLSAIAMFWLLDYVAGLWIPEGEAWYWQLLSQLAWLLAIILAMMGAVVGYIVLASAAIAPWLDTLAYRSEIMMGQKSEENRSGCLQQVGQSLVNSLRPVLLLLAWGAAAVIFFWLPPLATAIWVYGGLQFLSFELMDTTASRRGWRYSRRKIHYQEQRWFYLGFSSLAAMLMLIPVLNLCVLPAAVVALTQHMIKKG